MNLNEYQSEAFKLARYQHRGEGHLWYPALGLAGECLEALEAYEHGSLDELFGELGDMCWYMGAVAREMGVTLEACWTSTKLELDELMSQADLFHETLIHAGRAAEHIKKAYRDDDFEMQEMLETRSGKIMDYLGASLKSMAEYLKRMNNAMTRSDDPKPSLGLVLEKNLEKLRAKRA